MVKIVKFGGSSLADAHQFKKVGDIIKSDPDRRFVVPSAPGKRFKDDIKVTDLLYKAYNAESEQEFECTFDTIKDRYQRIKQRNELFFLRQYHSFMPYIVLLIKTQNLF